MKRTSPIPKAGKEVLLSAANLNAPEARLVVAEYYDAQERRKRADMQIRHLGDRKELPILEYSADAYALIEIQINKALLKYAESSAVGEWCLSHVGIGPVITAGLIAHLDITKARAASNFWSFAGLNPEQEWKRGEKRPWNAALKQVCFHLGECVKRVSNHPDAYYGQLYKERKEELVQRNEAGGNAERAKVFVTKSAEVKKTLAEGKLPAGNLDRQACNYVAKIFLSHLHGVMWWEAYKQPPPKPFAIEHLGHTHLLEIPNTEMFPGFRDAYYGPRREAAE
jgi:hypothetical protein